MDYEIIFKNIYNKESIDKVKYSIVTPVYNQEKIILRNVTSFLSHTKDYYEIIIIIDCCSDNTKSILLDFFSKHNCKNPQFVQITIFETSDPYFETKCDNLGFKNSIGEYIIEIQADMKMTEPGYNIHLQKPFKLFDNLLAVSGRCGHNLFNNNICVGKIGRRIERTLKQLKLNRNTFYVTESCNRGPIMFDAKKLKEIDYLDEENYFLHDSDHEIMARAYLEKGYICGYLPMDFHSLVREGSMRKGKERDKKNSYKLSYLKNKPRIDKIKLYSETWKERGIQKYDISDI